MSISFGGVPWGADLNTAMARLRGAGFTCYPTPEGHLAGEGEIMGLRAFLSGEFDEGGLSSVGVRLQLGERLDPWDQFNNLKDALTCK